MWEDRKNYIRQDDMGRWINIEFPPQSFEKYPYNAGYKNANMEMLYYEFAVQIYCLRIIYKDTLYLAFTDGDDAYITDEDENIISEIYPTANDLIKNFRFPDGMKLPDIVTNANAIDIDLA